MQEGLEFGPNATWTNYPKTKLVFMAARTDNLAMAQVDGLKDHCRKRGVKSWSPWQ